MNKLKILFLLFFNIAVSQEPAPYFKINIDQLSVPAGKECLEKYEFTTGLFSNLIDDTAFESTPQKTEDQFIKSEAGYLYLFISGKFAPSPQKGNVISINIRDKETGSNMAVFIRISAAIDYGMPVEMKDLSFLPGNYYLDLCNSDTPLSPYTINLGSIKAHAIEYKKINEQILNHNCS